MVSQHIQLFLQDVKELQLTDNPSFDFKATDGPSIGDGYVDRLVIVKFFTNLLLYWPQDRGGGGEEEESARVKSPVTEWSHDKVDHSLKDY